MTGTNNAYTWNENPKLPWQKQHSTRRLFSKIKLDFNLRKNLDKCYTWSTALYGAETSFES
jgi:hypothetical protein